VVDVGEDGEDHLLFRESEGSVPLRGRRVSAVVDDSVHIEAVARRGVRTEKRREGRDEVE